MNGISALTKEVPERHGEKMPSVNQEAGPHQAWNLPVP